MNTTHAFSFRAPSPRRRQEDGIAIILVLAFLVLLTGLVFAFFSRAVTERQVANASLNQSKADIFARSAVDVIVGDFKQEIVAGSSPAPSGYPLYVPTSNLYMLPESSGTPSPSPSNSPYPIPNLVRRSVRADPLASLTPTAPLIHAVTTSASAVNSTTNASTNGRAVSLARWNSHYLIPRDPALYSGNSANTIGTDPIPSFTAPDWVMVTKTGPKVLTAPDPDTIGRYAYAIYDEGGLLDINVAGYPSQMNLTQSASKASLTFADLSTLPNPIPKTATTAGTSQVDQIVGWRNYASLSRPPAYASPAPASSPPGGTFPNLNVSAQNANNFWYTTFGSTSGFLGVNPGTYPSPVPASGSARTDQYFNSRQSLLNFRRATGFSQNALQFLGTFSRDINQPSFMPVVGRPTVLAQGKGGNNAAPDAPGVTTPLDDKINPSFLKVRVAATTTNPTRNDGTAFIRGEPLVKRRFALQRLAWLTYKGPSSQRTLPTSNPGASTADYDMWQLVSTYGITPEFLKLGTPQNISKYFGLTFSGGVWKYNVHNGAQGTGPTGSIMKLEDIAALTGNTVHEPDFFELLKASLQVGSLGRAATTSPTDVASPSGSGIASASVPLNYRYALDTSVDYQIIKIAANIIDQFDVDGFPTRISFDSGDSAGASFPREFQGVENVPYLNYVFNSMVQAQRPSPPAPNNADYTYYYGRYSYAIRPTSPSAAAYQAYGMLTDPGVGILFQTPSLWNPHDANGSVGNPRPSQFRVVLDSTDPDHLDMPSAYQKVYTASRAFVNTPLPDPTKNPPNLNTYGKNPEPSFKAESSSPMSPAFTSDLYNRSRRGIALNSTNTALQFTDVNGTLFREPTVLLWPNTPAAITSTGSGDLPNGIQNTVGNPIGFPSSGSDAAPGSVLARDAATPSAKTNFVGLYLGAFPLRFLRNVDDPDTTGIDNVDATLTAYEVDLYQSTGGTGSNDQNNVYLTYRVQCQDPQNLSSWITYDTKYAKTTPGYLDYRGNDFGGSFPTTIMNEQGAWAAAIDPRTSRFGMVLGTPRSGFDTNASLTLPGPEHAGGDLRYSHGWTDPQSGALTSARPDRDAGYFFIGGRTGDDSNNIAGQYDTPLPIKFPGWVGSTVENFQDYRAFDIGMLSQNHSGIQVRRGRFYGDGGYRDDGGIARVMNPIYYADADGVVRRASAGYVPNGAQTYPVSPKASSSDSTIGLPMARALEYSSSYKPSLAPTHPVIQPDASLPLNQAQSRPMMLNRPFRTVGELGYVYRDTPWKNLDFFMPESGDSTLLDVFCINDTDNPGVLVAGKVNLNTRQAPVLAAIIAGAAVDDPKVTDATVGQISPTLGMNIANALVKRTSDLTTPENGPYVNSAGLVGRWIARQPVAPAPSGTQHVQPPLDSAGSTFYQDGRLSYKGFSGSELATDPIVDLNSAFANSLTGSANSKLLQSMTYIQRFHEAPMRALSAVGQTRTWNLMIDVVAQTGRYPATAANATNPLAAFVVEGEQRYWVHIAIDRFTGEVLDKQIEVVKE